MRSQADAAESGQIEKEVAAMRAKRTPQFLQNKEKKKGKKPPRNAKRKLSP